MQTFKQALIKRDLWRASDSIQYIYKDLEYPIEEVYKYFRREDNLSSAAKGAEVNFFFIDEHIEKLEQMAKEIDEDYVGEKAH